MKKFVGIIAALAMLCSVASAAELTLGSSQYDEANQKIVAIYTGYTAGTQATMLAYDVTDIDGASIDTEFVDTTTTPIMGIDQYDASGNFEFPIPEDFEGKIAIRIGGADVETPIKALVEVKKSTGGEEGGEGEGETTVIFSYVWGDVTGDGEITAADVTAIYTTFAGGTGISSGGYVVGEKLYGSDYVWGDVTGDGEITAADVTAVYTTFAGGTGISSGGYVVGTDRIEIEGPKQ